MIEYLETENPAHLPATERDWTPPSEGLEDFDDLYEVVFRHAQPTSYEAFARLLGTTSATIRLAPARRAELIEEARAVAVERGAFDADGIGEIPLNCELFALRRRP